MKHSLSKLFAVSAVVLFPVFAPAQDEEENEEKAFYRVEAIIFTHAGGQPDAWPLEQFADHSGALDPAWKAFAREQELARAERDAAYSDSELEATLSVVETLDELESGQATLTEALLYPEPWLALETLSEPMARARARLEDSGAYRVQDWLAWHQPLDNDSPVRAIRLHDDRLIAVDWIALSPTGQPLRSGRPAKSAGDLLPTFHYRLDGTIRLRQRQFMHGDVTIDWRVPERIGPLPSPISDGIAAFEHHRLQQSRTIRPDRFEYFDSEWLGVVLRVTPWTADPASGQEGDDDGETGSP